MDKRMINWKRWLTGCLAAVLFLMAVPFPAYAAEVAIYSDKITRGKTSRVAFDDAERERIAAELRGDNPNAKVDISRFKGLGEMDAHELWETTMDPTTRTLRRITLDDAAQADATFNVLMGEKVEPRKAFIERNAKYAVNLDY